MKRIRNYFKFEDFVYMVYDTISHYPLFFATARSDAEAIRKVLLTLRVPIKDSQLWKIGSFSPNTDSANFERLDKLQLVDWSNYRFPETTAQALEPLGCTPDEVSEIIRNIGKKTEIEGEINE